MIFKLLRLEFKNFIKFLPYIVIGGIIPLFIIGSVCFYGANNLYKDQPLGVARVAVVTEDIDQSYVDFALNYLDNLDSTSLALEFVEMSASEANEALDRRDIIAVISFNMDQLNGIMYGANIPIDVTFSDSLDITSVILTELTRAGASFLSSAQASTYTLAQIYRSHDAGDYLQEAFNSIDYTNFTYVLQRGRSFSNVNGNYGGTANLLSYYVGNGLMIYILLLGCAFAPRFAAKETAFFERLKLNKIPVFVTNLISFLCYYICLVLYTSLLIFAISKVDLVYLKGVIGLSFNMRSFLYVLLICLFASAYTTFIYSLSRKTQYCVLLQFIITLIICFISGGFLPRAFMPMSVNKIANFTRLSDIQYLFTCLVADIRFDKPLVIVIIAILLLTLGCLITLYKYNRGDNRS